MNSRRALLAVLLAGGQALPASAAGCLDWLFCKSPYPAPYAAGYAPQATVTPLGPPTPVGPPVTTAVGAYSAYPQASPYQAAMNPAWAANYGYNNPSVLTGAPVNPNAPIVAGYRGQMPATVNPWGGYLPQTSYNAAAAYQAPASGLVPVPPATTGFSHPMQATPLPPTTGTGGFMGTVLGTAYQTTYNNVPTTVYRPVQQVDPRTGQTVIVQQPCATTTQQVQRMPYGQFQQAPVVPTAPYGEATCGTEGFSNMAPAAGTALPPTAAYPQPSTYPPQAYSQPTTAGGYAAPTNGSGVAQTSAMTAPGTYGAAPIPSTIPLPAPPSATAAPSTPAGSYGAPPATSGSGATGSATTGGYNNTVSPPSGYGSGSSSTYGSGTIGSGTTGNGSGDASKVEQPRLPASSSSSSSSNTPSSSSTTGSSSSYGGSGSYGSGSYGSSSSNNSGTSSNSGTSATESSWSKSKAPLTGASSRYSDLPPIPASDAYQPPAWNQGNGQEASAPSGQYPNGQNPGSQSPRISPPSWNDRTAMRIGEPGASDAIGHAATPTGWQRPATPPQVPAADPAKRRNDSGWVSLDPNRR